MFFSLNFRLPSDLGQILCSVKEVGGEELGILIGEYLIWGFLFCFVLFLLCFLRVIRPVKVFCIYQDLSHSAE